MTRRKAIKYPDAELVTHAAVDRAMEYFHGIRTPSNTAAIHGKVRALIEVGGLMLFRHRESLLLTALNDEQRAVLAEFQAATTTQPTAKEEPTTEDAEADADGGESPAPH